MIVWHFAVCSKIYVWNTLRDSTPTCNSSVFSDWLIQFIALQILHFLRFILWNWWCFFERKYYSCFNELRPDFCGRLMWAFMCSITNTGEGSGRFRLYYTLKYVSVSAKKFSRLNSWSWTFRSWFRLRFEKRLSQSFRIRPCFTHYILTTSVKCCLISRQWNIWSMNTSVIYY